MSYRKKSFLFIVKLSKNFISNNIILKCYLYLCIVKQINKYMNSVFTKIIRSSADSMYAYDFKKKLLENGWLEKVHNMFDTMDVSVIQKVWTSILYRLPMTVVSVGRLSDKDCEIVSNFREIDNLMRILNAYNNNDLWLDPFSCELALESNNGKFVLLNDVYDTFNMITYLKEYEQSLASDAAKKTVHDNLTLINSLMQQYPVSLRYIGVQDAGRQPLIDSLHKFYSKLDNITY